MVRTRAAGKTEMTMRAALRRLPMVLAALLGMVGWAQAASAQADIPDSVLTTATLPKGPAVSSTVDRVGDADWYKVTLRDANAYQITTTGPAVIRIYDNAGVLRASSGTKKYYVWRTPVTGTFFIAAEGTGTRTGAYTIKYAIYDESANTATESRMTIGTPKTGRMRNSGNLDFFGDPNRFPPDEDWTRLDVKTSGCYLVEATMDNPDYIDHLRVHDVYGNTLQERSCTSTDADGFYTGCVGPSDGILTYLTPGRYFLSLLAGPAGATQGGYWSATVTARPDAVLENFEGYSYCYFP